MTTHKDDREEFEAFICSMRKINLLSADFFKDTVGDYVDPRTQREWKVWQAAKRGSRSEAPQIIRVPKAHWVSPNGDIFWRAETIKRLNPSAKIVEVGE